MGGICAHNGTRHIHVFFLMIAISSSFDTCSTTLPDEDIILHIDSYRGGVLWVEILFLYTFPTITFGINLSMNLPQPFIRHMRIDLRSGDIAMA